VSTVVDGLTADTTYYFKVQAIAAVVGDNSDFSTVVDAKTDEGKTGLDTPENLALNGLVADAVTETSVDLKWDAITSATGYEIRYCLQNGTSWTVVNAGSGTNFKVTNLANGTPYWFQIRAVIKDAKGTTTVVSDWTTQTTTVGQKTEGDVATPNHDRKSRPAVRAGNAKTGTAPTIDTIQLTLPAAPAGGTFVVTFDPSKIKFPKGFTWNGESYVKGQEEKFVRELNAEIRIEDGKAVISGLPAGMKFTFNVQSLSADGTTLSQATVVSASTTKYAATKIRAMKAPDAPSLTSITLQPTAPKVLQDTAFDVSYEIVVSYVANKTTFYSTFTIAKKNNEVSFTEVPGTAGTAMGGFKGTTAPLPPGVSVAINAAGNIKFSGLPFAGTRYTFALRTVAEDVCGTKNFSAVARANVATAKYLAPKFARPVLTPTMATLTWTDAKAAAETTHYVVYQSGDKKGATVDTIFAVTAKATMTCGIAITEGKVNNVFFVAAVVLKDGVTDLAVVTKDDIVLQSVAGKTTVKATTVMKV
jgi:hypothetical protein